MPWTSAQARSHKKDLTDAETKTWARIANDALARCTKEGTSTKACEGRAIRIANAAINQARAKSMVANDGRDKEHVEFVPLSEDAKAAVGVPSANAIHGQGGTLSDTRGGYTCKCKDGHEYQSSVPCKESKCPKCKEKIMSEQERTAYKSYDEWQCYKSGDKWRWLGVSNVAVLDKENEIITEKAYDDAILHAETTGEYGELDKVHVDGTEIGNCDLMARLSNRLIESGEWYDAPRAIKAREIVSSNPESWGLSIKFVYDPEQFRDGIYQGGIRILKRSVLPRHMAASYGTAIAVTGGAEMAKQIDEETKAALVELGETEESIAELVEKQKALPADEENVVTKEDESEDVVNEVVVPTDQATSGSWLQDIKAVVVEALKISNPSETDTPEPSGEETVKKADTEVVTEDTQDGTETETEQKEVTEKVEEEKSSGPSTEEVLKAYSTTVATAVATAVAEKIAQIELAQQRLETKFVHTNLRMEELAKPIEEKVMDAINAQPPVVKVRASELQSTATELTPEAEQQKETLVSKLLEDISKEVAHKTSRRGVADGKYEV